MGGIGGTVLRELREGRLRELYRLEVACDRHDDKLAEAKRDFGCKITNDVRDVINHGIDVVLEAASIEAAAELLPEALETSSVVVMSTGVFAITPGLLEECVDVAGDNGTMLILPSGAIGGIDIVVALREEVEETVLTTRKPPESLGVDVDREEVLFEGPVDKAVEKFPRNVNVAATLATALGDPDLLTVRVVADPKAECITHEIELKTDVGEYRIEVKNEPLPEVPRTSALAAMSAVATLEKLASPLRVGT